MNWILIVYLLVLIYLAVKRDRFPNAAALRPAWISFALIPISSFFFAMIRASNFRDPRDVALTEIWANGIEWLLLGISMLTLTGMLAPNPEWGSHRGDSSPRQPPPPAA